MAFHIRQVDYFYLTIDDEPSEAFKALSSLAGVGINLLAFAGVPEGHERTQLTLFPEDSRATAAAPRIGLALDGPHSALLATGDDELGALAGVHEKLAAGGVEVYASTGVSDDRGGFGYVLYVRADELDAAVRALEI